MKRLLAALMISLVLLCGCGEDKSLQRLQQSRQEIEQAEHLSFLTHVSAELSDSVFDCSLKLERQDGQTRMEVIAPEIIAGISAVISGKDTAIEYEDTVLVIGDAVLGEVSPVAAVAQLLDSLGSGYVDAVWTETQGEQRLVAAQYYISENQYMIIWFDEENMLPVNAELVSGGRVVVKCRIEDFCLNQNPQASAEN